MSTTPLPFHITTFHTSTTVNHRRRISTSASNGGANWWSPLFGWSSDAEYIDSSGNDKKTDPDPNVSNSDLDRDRKEGARSKFTPGRLTEEKAKQLRMMTMDSASYHDVMYHSAIASRLASDFSTRSDQ